MQYDLKVEMSKEKQTNPKQQNLRELRQQSFRGMHKLF